MQNASGVDCFLLSGLTGENDNPSARLKNPEMGCLDKGAVFLWAHMSGSGVRVGGQVGNLVPFAFLGYFLL